MSDTWDFYFARVNDEFASLFVDLGLAEGAPDAHRPWLLWAWVYLNDPNEAGMPTDEEAATLDEIETALMEEVEEAAAAELVGRISTAGRREFYFYGTTQTGFEDAIARAMAAWPDYRFDSGIEHDPEWGHYLGFLYPSPHDQQRIKNRHVVQLLEEHGDNLEKPRIVSHWAYFPSAEARAQFVAQAKAQQFRVTSEHQLDEPDREMPFSVRLERIDPLDWNSINELTISLFDLAEECGGTYDGWEAGLADS